MGYSYVVCMCLSFKCSSKPALLSVSIQKKKTFLNAYRPKQVRKHVFGNLKHIKCRYNTRKVRVTPKMVHYDCVFYFNIWQDPGSTPQSTR